MIMCPKCGSQSSDLPSPCQICGFRPEQVDGFIAWSPELAEGNSGFNSQNFAGLAQAEAEHFWFRARNQLILWALGKYFPEVSSLLEVGCGTGFVLSGIARQFPEMRLVGSEIYTSGLAFAAQRVPGVELVQMDAKKLPYVEEFDVVAAFDVIEHIEEDELVLQNIYRAIKPGGGCLITVPQHMWLWSAIDEQACHQRRYHSGDLHAKIEAAGFQILRSTSFISLLLPVMALSRLLQKNVSDNEADATEGLKISFWLNSAFFRLLAVETGLIKTGLNFPMGGSRLVVAKKHE
jgi:SAM-dependent methyltransferase